MMVWDVVLALLERVEADTGPGSLVGIFGDDIYRAGDRPLSVPSLVYAIASDTEGENFEMVRIQWTIFVRTDAALVAAERRLRWMFHHETPVRIAGLRMWSQYAPGGRQNVEGLADGIRGSSHDFIYTPFRARYVKPAGS